MNFLYLAWILIVGFFLVITVNFFVKNLAIRDIERKYRIHYFVIAGIFVVIGMLRFDYITILGYTLSVELQYMFSYMLLFFSIWYNLYRYQIQER